MTPSGVITLLTDFGTADAFVGVMKGVIAGIHPQAHVIDLTHAIRPQHVLAGALVLRSAVDFFPAGTIHIGVVDPGVGSARRPLLVGTDMGWLIGPDNGLLGPASQHLGRRTVRLLENPEFFRHPVSHTFHGRDIFAPSAAHLARGVEPSRLGGLLDTMVELSVPGAVRTSSGISGQVVYVDHFGNLVTNIEAERLSCFPAQQVSVSIRGMRIGGLAGTYTSVPEGRPLAIVGSWGMLEIAVRNGSAADVLAATEGAPVTVDVESGDA